MAIFECEKCQNIFPYKEPDKPQIISGFSVAKRYDNNDIVCDKCKFVQEKGTLTIAL